MAGQNDDPADAPEHTAASYATVSRTTQPLPTPDRVTSEANIQRPVPSPNTVAHDPNNLHVIVGFYGDFTWDDIEGYRNRYRAAMTQSGITDVQLSTFLAASQLYLTPNATLTVVDKFSDGYNDALNRSHITRDQLSSLLAGSGLNLAPALYGAPSHAAVQTATEAGAPVPLTPPVPPQLSGEPDVSMTGVGDAGTAEGKKRTRKKVRFSDQ